MIAIPLAFSFILIIKCVSGSKKLLMIFGGSESKQKETEFKTCWTHQPFILHSNPKMECLTVFIFILSPMLYFTSETQSYGKL